MQDQPPKSVLVVDDDQDILRLVVTILRRLHLQVFSAGSAEEALRVFNEMPAPPDLLLTDIVMPGGDGAALAERILRIYPKVRVLFMSGFDNKFIAQNFVVDAAFPLLPKPFTFEKLGAKVTEILSGGQQQFQFNT